MIGDPGKNVGEPGLRIDPVEFGGFDERARAHSDPMESDRRSNFLFGRIFFDEPVSTSSENALARLPPCGWISRQRDDGHAFVRKAGYAAYLSVLRRA